jgi:hypothetical protein
VARDTYLRKRDFGNMRMVVVEMKVVR